MSAEAYYNLAQCAAMRYVNHGRRPDDYRTWLMWLEYAVTMEVRRE